MSRLQYTIKDICQIVKGEMIQSAATNLPISELIIDSRHLMASEGILFIALSSKRNDGHKYIEEIYEKGVRNFLIEE